MKTLIAFIAATGLIQGTVCAEEPWRFVTLADWHVADVYVLPRKYPGAAERVEASFKMLKTKYGGELVLLPGDSNIGHWDRPEFIKEFRPGLTPAQSILQAGELCYSGMVNAFREAGYSRLLMAVGDHELGDNPWVPGSARSICQPQFRQAFAKVFNFHPKTGRFIYDRPIGRAPSRPLGTKYETTSYAYQHKNVLFVTVDVFHQEDPHKRIGSEGSVTGEVSGKHLAWLDRVLSEARKEKSIKHIFVQAHLPVLHPVRKVNSSGMLMDGEMNSEFWKTLRKHKVDIYFAGEVHANTVTKDPKSDLVQLVSRAKFLSQFLTVDVTDEKIDITCFNQIAPKPSDGKYEVCGKLVIDKSSGKKSFKDQGELAFLDRNARLIHYDFEKSFALEDRQVVGLATRGGNPFRREVIIQGTGCDRSFANRGTFGQNYDAHFRAVASTDGPRGQAGVFNPRSRMAIWALGPHVRGNTISYALWMKTTSKENMVVINTHMGRGNRRKALRNFMNLNLANGLPELMIAEDARLIAKGPKLNDGKWHHIAVSMPKKDCRLSEVQFYVDGQSVKSDVVGQDTRVNVSLATKLSFGGFGHTIGPLSKLGVKPFEGALDEISVWARGLTATEVGKLAKSGDRK